MNPIRPQAMDHIGIKVTNLARSVHFYHDILGLDLPGHFNQSTSEARAATVQAGDQKIDIFYREDFVEADKDKPVGMDHLCLIVDVESVDSLLDYLKASDVEVMWGPVTRRSTTSVYVFDPDGIHVELRFKVPVAAEPDGQRAPASVAG